MRLIAVSLLLAVTLAGCGAVDSMTDGFRHSQEVATDLGKSVGSKPFVGFNWRNGSLVNVTVTFQGVPQDKSAQEIAELSRQSVAAHFQQAPERIVVSFSLPGR